MAESPSERDTSVDLAGRMAGEYRLGRKLGEGGFGAVYEAEHPLLKRRAAVKVLHKIAGADSDAVLRFVSEAQAVNQIRNRHIIDVFSFGKLPDGHHFYVMDLLEGEPLDRYLKRGPCDPVTVVQLLRPLADALDAAHAAGIVHRDLKPQNVYLAWESSGETVPKLLDFGMAKLLGESSVHTVSGTPIGTPLYMSPEQARGEKVDGRSDVYSLGVLCHELLTGKLPITGDTTIAVLMAHIMQAPPRVSEVRPELGEALDGAVLHMLEKQPEARPSTAGEALAELARAVNGSGLTIPNGLAHLPRPERVEPPAPPSGALETEATLLDRMGTPEGSVSPRPAEPARAARRPSWPAMLALVLFGALCAYLVARSLRPAATVNDLATQLPATRASVSAALPAVSAPPAPPPVPSASATVIGSAPSSAAPVAPSAPPKGKKHAPGQRAIPSDLESPF